MPMWETIKHEEVIDNTRKIISAILDEEGEVQGHVIEQLGKYKYGEKYYGIDIVTGDCTRYTDVLCVAKEITFMMCSKRKQQEEGIWEP